jgi:hypothetical protein
MAKRRTFTPSFVRSTHSMATTNLRLSWFSLTQRAKMYHLNVLEMQVVLGELSESIYSIADFHLGLAK